MVLIFVAILWAIILYVFFLAYVALLAAKREGRIDSLPWFARIAPYAVLITAGLVDVGFNVAVGTVLFLELPDRLTFTQRCEKWMPQPGWRGAIARWVCNGWLNPIQPGHCH